VTARVIAAVLALAALAGCSAAAEPSPPEGLAAARVPAPAAPAPTLATFGTPAADRPSTGILAPPAPPADPGSTPDAAPSDYPPPPAYHVDLGPDPCAVQHWTVIACIQAGLPTWGATVMCPYTIRNGVSCTPTTGFDPATGLPETAYCCTEDPTPDYSGCETPDDEWTLDACGISVAPTGWTGLVSGCSYHAGCTTVGDALCCAAPPPAQSTNPWAGTL
jgi:hypothetical protein